MKPDALLRQKFATVWPMLDENPFDVCFVDKGSSSHACLFFMLFAARHVGQKLSPFFSERFTNELINAISAFAFARGDR